MGKGLPRSLGGGRAKEIESILLGSPALGDVDILHAAVTDNGSEQEITTGLSNPDIPRNVTATAGGTADDIKAIQVIVEGTDEEGNALTETLPAFTVNTAGTVVGSKVFATITKFTIPAHDGTGATTSLGTGAKLGIGRKLKRDTVLNAYLNGAREATRPTVAVSATAISANHITLNSALDGNPVIVDLYN